jgi:hypothetical protein
MKRKSRDWDLTLELSCHAGCPTGTGDVVCLIPLKKKKPIPGIPIDVVAVNFAVFAISI